MTNAFPDGISVFVISLLKFIGGDGKVTPSGQGFQLIDGSFLVGVFNFVTDRKPESLFTEVVVSDLANVFSRFCLRLTKAPKNRKIIRYL